MLDVVQALPLHSNSLAMSMNGPKVPQLPTNHTSPDVPIDRPHRKNAIQFAPSCPCDTRQRITRSYRERRLCYDSQPCCPGPDLLRRQLRRPILCSRCRTMESRQRLRDLLAGDSLKDNGNWLSITGWSYQPEGPPQSQGWQSTYLGFNAPAG